MGFVFTLLYILTAYLSPALLFGSVAQFHLEIVLACLALLASVPNLRESGVLRAPQTLAVLGMCFAVTVSLIAAGWIGGAPAALYEFLPDSFAFFLVAINCRTRRRLQILVGCMVLASFYIISQGAIALRNGEIVSPWLYDQGFEGNHIMRIRGLALVNDPNDFAQVLVSLLALSFLLWRPRKPVWNVLAVLLPSLLLLYGVFLTHSRGALLALTAVIALAVYRKFGLIPALVMAGSTFALAMALSWSGGRDVSVEAGEDRLDAWSTGLTLIKSHPIFGVGYRRFTEFNEITAHNTIVVCAAELGFVGFYFWVLFVVSSIREGLVLRVRKAKRTFASMSPSALEYASPALQLSAAGAAGVNPYLLATAAPGSAASSATGQTDPGRDAPFGVKVRTPETEESIRSMAWVIVVGLSGFLVAGWFLSRAYVMWLFVWGGMMQSVYTMASQRGMVPPAPPLSKLLKLSGWISIALILIVYIILRVKQLLPA